MRKAKIQMIGALRAVPLSFWNNKYQMCAIKCRRESFLRKHCSRSCCSFGDWLAENVRKSSSFSFDMVSEACYGINNYSCRNCWPGGLMVTCL